MIPRQHAVLAAVFRRLIAEAGIDPGAHSMTLTRPFGRFASPPVTLSWDEFLVEAECLGAPAEHEVGATPIEGHSPLPWRVGQATADRGLVVWDATETSILVAATDFLTEPEGQANARLVARACTAYPAFLSALQAAVHALRSYQYGNEAPDLAREIADACEAVLAQMEGR